MRLTPCGPSGRWGESCTDTRPTSMCFSRRSVCETMSGSESGLSRMCFSLDLDHGLRGLHRDLASLSQTPPYVADSYLSSDGDQVVPSSVRGGAVPGPRESKPLPPLPDAEELMSDEAADQEVEFFTSDRRCLLPKSTWKPGGGKVNHAYQDAAGSVAFSWPGCDGRTAACNWDGADSFWTKPDSCFPPKATDKPQVPPRIPIKPKNLTLTDDDKPPKVPPRVPLVPPCPPRTPSPKSLPIYINGVMPATQSFAANPNYVSKSLQRHHGERTASAAQPSPPCIVPILRDGRQASATHYLLLPPGRAASSGRRERLQSEPTRKCGGGGGFWKKR